MQKLLEFEVSLVDATKSTWETDELILTVYLFVREFIALILGRCWL